MRTPRYLSPLRYPGGKARMTPWLSNVFAADQSQHLDIAVWIEPFGGGAGAALTALEDPALPLDAAWIIEANPVLAAFWQEVTGPDADTFARRVESYTPDLAAFWSAREIVADRLTGGDGHSRVDLAWAGFILNRCSRSGMVRPNVGPIGGKHQSGRDGVGARWNGPALAQRLRRIAAHGDRFQVREGDGITYLEDLPASGIADETFVFADPPYIGVGNALYAHGMDRAQHERLARALMALPGPWAATYDAHPDVLGLYGGCDVWEFAASHTAHVQQVGVEYLVCPAWLDYPVGNPLGAGDGAFERVAVGGAGVVRPDALVGLGLGREGA